MRIDCPNCAAAYEVPEPILAARRLMRCARCGTDFTPAAPSGAHPTEKPAPEYVVVESPPTVPTEAVIQQDDRMGLSVLPQDPPAQPRRAAILAAWVLSFALLGAGAWAVIAWRGPIMHAWPASARLYLALGYTR